MAWPELCASRSHVSPFDAPAILFDPGERFQHKYRSKGTLDEWRRSVSQPCAGNSRLVLALSAGFAAPLLRFFTSGLGFGFHFRGLSSSGKTTALLLAGSVWGGGEYSNFLDTWRNTANGIEAKAALHNDALLCLDEIGELNEKEASEIIYALANGKSKGRMNKGIRAGRGFEYCTLFLSSGERTLTDVFQSAGKQLKGGHDTRLIEVPVDAGLDMGIFESIPDGQTPAGFSATLKQAAGQFYGVAIAAFLTKIARARQDAEAEIRSVRDSFLDRNLGPAASGEVHKVASFFGVVAGARELATRLGITGWREGEAVSTAKTCFRAWIENRGGEGHRDVQMGAQAILSFIEQYGTIKFETFKQFGSEPIHSHERVGFREDREGEIVYYFFPEPFHKILAGYDSAAIAAELNRRGLLLKPNADRRFQKNKRFAGLGVRKIYEIHLPDSVEEPAG